MRTRENIWADILHELQASGRGYYWVSKLQFISIQNNTLVLSTNSNFIKDKVLINYSDDVLQIAQTRCSSIKALNIHLLSNNLIQTNIKFKTTNNLERYSILNKKFTFNNYVTDQSNQLAYAISQRVASTNNLEYNPIFLCGPVGIGKTHLMQAIANTRRINFTTQRLIYLPAERFTYLFLNYLKNKNIQEFRDLFKYIDLLLIDDLQFINSKIATQNEFYFILNEFLLSNRQLVIASSRALKDLQFGDNLLSRLASGIVANINSTTYQLRLNILKLKTKQLGIQVPNDVLQYMARNIITNIRELEGDLHKLVLKSNIMHEPLSINLIKSELQDILKKEITVDCINNAVCSYFAISINNLLSNTRANEILIPRQIAMYLIKTLINKSYPEISVIFNKKHHSTVIHAVKKVIDNPYLYNLSDIISNTLIR